jgi:hypothetical protein
MASYPASTPGPVYVGRPDRESGVGLKVLAVFLGLAVAMMAVVGLVLLSATLSARHDARDAAAKAEAAAAAAKPAATALPGMEMPATTAAGAAGAYATPSYAGLAPANADTLATEHARIPPSSRRFAPARSSRFISRSRIARSRSRPASATRRGRSARAHPAPSSTRASARPSA